MINKLFVYGTLGPGRPNEHLLKKIGGSWQAASVRGTLYSEGWGAAMGYPGIILGEDGEEVEGFLFTSDDLHAHWSDLDEFEGKAYERIPTMATIKDGIKVPAYIYALRR